MHVDANELLFTNDEEWTNLKWHFVKNFKQEEVM